MHRPPLYFFLVMNLLGVAALGQSAAPAYDPFYAPTYYTAPALRGSDGNFYGEDYAGGLYSVSLTGVYKSLHASLGGTLCLETPGGSLLGIIPTGTSGGQEFATITLEGVVTPLATVTGDAECPVMGADGNYYGLENNGGAYSYGAIYKLTSAGEVTILYDFSGAADGKNPGALIQASDGNLYGVDEASDVDNLFRYSSSSGLAYYPLPTGQAVNFSVPLLEASDENFYSPAGGMTKITPQGVASTLAPAPTQPFGQGAYLQVFLGGDQRLYAATQVEGYGDGCSELPSPYAAMVPIDLSGNVYPDYFDLTEFPSVQIPPGGSYGDGSSSATMLQGGDGNFYGGVSLSSEAIDQYCDPAATSQVNYIFGEIAATPPTPPIAMTLSADHILPGKTATLHWQVNNAYSDTMKQCYGYGGLQGKVAMSGTVTSPALPQGTYSAAIICGGTETGFVTVTAGNTQVTLSTSSPVITGENVVLEARVANDGNPTPTGTVQFLFGTTVVASGKLNANGYLDVLASTAGIPPGTYNLVASYLGDGNYTPAKSAPVTVTVLPKYAITLTVTPSTQTVVQGATASLAITLKEVSGTIEPSGTVSLLLGSQVVASTAVTPGSPSTANFSLATLNVPVGTYPLTVQYSGDGANLPSSTPASITIVYGDTVAVTASPNPVPAGDGFALTATVSGTHGTPTGTVFFYAGSDELASSSLNGGGVASVTLASGTLPTGQYQITAHYAGDAQDAAVTSPAITLTVQ